MLRHFITLSLAPPINTNRNRVFSSNTETVPVTSCPLVICIRHRFTNSQIIWEFPKEIIERTPTTDTYSAEQTQEEFFYQLPFTLMDRFWYGFENGYPADEVAAVMGETKERVEALYRNFERKRKTTEYLRMPPIRDYFGL